MVEVADQLIMEMAPRPSQPHRSVSPVMPYRAPPPAACGRVLFPRSLLCAGRPASFGPYATYPWNYCWS